MFLQHRMTRALVTVAGIALAAAACGGSSSGGGGTQTVNTGSGGATKAATVATHSGPDGAYLTDASGRTVYIFAKDKGSTSYCTGDCTKEWIPFTTSGTPSAKGSATAGMVATSDRTDGTTQVTYAGHPLYYYVDDAATGDMKGQGLDDFGGLWSAVTPAGSALTTSQPSATPSSSGGSTSQWG